MLESLATLVRDRLRTAVELGSRENGFDLDELLAEEDEESESDIAAPSGRVDEAVPLSPISPSVANIPLISDESSFQSWPETPPAVPRPDLKTPPPAAHTERVLDLHASPAVRNEADRLEDSLQAESIESFEV